MPTIKIPSPLRSYTNGLTEVQVRGETVAEAMGDFISQYPVLRQHLYNSTGELRPFVHLYLDKEDIHHLRGLDTPLSKDDCLRIVPSIAGGA